MMADCEPPIRAAPATTASVATDLQNEVFALFTLVRTSLLQM